MSDQKGRKMNLQIPSNLHVGPPLVSDHHLDPMVWPPPIYSRLSLNGHLELVPAFLYSLYLTLYKTDTSLRRTLSASPKGVRLRES